MNIQPLNNTVVVKSVPKSNSTSSGILLPDVAGEAVQGTGFVCAVAYNKHGVKDGMQILFNNHRVQSTEIDGEKYFFIPMKDVRGFIEGENVFAVGSHIVLEAQEEAEVTKSGLFIPEVARSESKKTIGKIVSLGFGKRVSEYSLGEVVVYPRFQCTEVQLFGKTFEIVNAKDILGKIA